MDWKGDKKIYSGACEIVRGLQEHGYSAYFAGGSVRDMLLGRNAHDIDIAASALPDDVLKIFPRCHRIGAAFGIINVVINDVDFEVATFREERGYSDGRRPDEIRYTDDPALDAKRRDFTINSMFYDPAADRILDFENGLNDLKKQVLRTVGSADARFSEDYLRILRAVRFSAALGFSAAPDIPDAVKRNLAGLKKISAERIRDELDKMFTGPNPADALRILSEYGILDVVLPEVESMRGVEQPEEFHPEGDVFVHTCLMLEYMEKTSTELAWAVILHDVGKPATFSVDENGVPHFYGHEKKGAEIAHNVLKRLKFPNAVIDDVVTAVGGHMRFAHVREMRESKLKRLLADPTFPLQLELHRLDCISSHRKMGNYDFLCARLENAGKEVELPPPLLTGRDLIDRGMTPGPEFGNILKELMDMQLEGKLNSREEALDYLSEHYPEDT